jgi:hypothetical protein
MVEGLAFYRMTARNLAGALPTAFMPWLWRESK